MISPETRGDSSIMGYPPEHREATRARIIESAGEHFRRKGYDGARIDEIMASAGLTRGGFYLHFGSKQDLFAATMGQELEFARRLRDAADLEGNDGKPGSRIAIEYYLNPKNRNKIARGCTIVSNAADLARAKPAARRAFSSGFDELVDEFEAIAARGVSTKKAKAEARERALAAVSTCVGAVILARALDGESRVNDVLEASRRTALALLEGRSA